MSDDTIESEDVDGEGSAENADAVIEPEADLLYGCLTSESRGQAVLHANRDDWFEIATLLFQDGWNMCVDVTAVDYLTYEPARNLPSGITPERFELVASFISHERRDRIRARVQIPELDPTVASLYSIYPGTDHLEREVFDMFGIVFEGHPDLSRILMPETWQGHPLRKDFALGRIPVQFKGTDQEAGQS